MARRTRIQMERLRCLRKLIVTYPPSGCLDYKEFLGVLYDEARRLLVEYSFKLFSSDVGLGENNALWLVVRGKRRLSKKLALRIAQNLQLGEREQTYFITLVQYNNSVDGHEKDKLQEKLLSQKRGLLTETRTGLELDFYSQWYHAIIFEMVGLSGFRSDPDWICKTMRPHITPHEAKQSLMLLETLNLIRYDDTLGRHVKLVRDFNSSPDVPGVGVMRFHQVMIDLGKEALNSFPDSEREIGAVTICLSEDAVQQIKEETRRFRDFVMFVASRDTGEAGVVMQINLQAFPITHRVEPAESGVQDAS